MKPTKTVVKLYAFGTQMGAAILLLLMFFVAVEKGFGWWDEIQQDQIELAESSDADADNGDGPEEDSDDFLHDYDVRNDIVRRVTFTVHSFAFQHSHFRTDVFTPPPEA